MKPEPLIAASAVFFFLWAVMLVTLASHGSIGSGSVIFLLSLVSLAGSVQFLRAMRRESPPRWFRGHPVRGRLYCSSALDGGSRRGLCRIIPGTPPPSRSCSFSPPGRGTAPLLLPGRLPEEGADATVVVAILGIVSLFLAFGAFLIPPLPCPHRASWSLSDPVCPPPHAGRRAAPYRGGGGGLPMKHLTISLLLALACTAGC
ncbi:hypothetical protein, partial [Methanoculleus chikugoensis]|uniref:hypothetical protein n=1 Tax=Methanoculleus chikugoensis TaxID=118126 RepID=UPI000A6756D1